MYANPNILGIVKIRQHANTTAHMHPCRTLKPNIRATALTVSFRATMRKYIAQNTRTNTSGENSVVLLFTGKAKNSFEVQNVHVQ